MTQHAENYVTRVQATRITYNKLNYTPSNIKSFLHISPHNRIVVK